MTHSMRCAFHIPGLKSECCLDLCLQFDTMESPECPNDSILDLVIFDLLLSDSWDTHDGSSTLDHLPLPGADAWHPRQAFHLLPSA